MNFYILLKNKTIKSLVFILLLLSQVGCKKFVDIEAPYTSLTSDNVFTNDATAISVLTGVYTNMANNQHRFVTGVNSISNLAGLSADELKLFGGASNSNLTLVRFYLNNLKNIDNIPWNGLYACLFQVNNAIEKLNSSTLLTPAIKNQLLGEAKFIRGMALFYLVNFYGDIPMPLTSDYRINATLSKTPVADVYTQIINDLLEAKNLLSENYLDASLFKVSTERVRPTKWAAAAMLARVYLYKKDWSNAELQATSIISNSSQFSLSTLNNTFLRAGLGNKEAIWQLQPVAASTNTEDAKLFILTAAPSSTRPVSLSSQLLSSFEVGDMRRTNWTKDAIFSGQNYSYAFKYKLPASATTVDEYLMVLRLGEQYLIRAEARARQNNLSGAIDDLDKIRQRASLPLLAATNPGISQTALIDKILHERQVELFTEWGHRWLDLKRTENINSVMSVVTTQKNGTWNNNWSLYPIPLYELQQDLNLTQNLGY